MKYWAILHLSVVGQLRDTGVEKEELCEAFSPSLLLLLSIDTGSVESPEEAARPQAVCCQATDGTIEEFLWWSIFRFSNPFFFWLQTFTLHFRRKTPTAHSPHGVSSYQTEILIVYILDMLSRFSGTSSLPGIYARFLSLWSSSSRDSNEQ